MADSDTPDPSDTPAKKRAARHAAAKSPPKPRATKAKAESAPAKVAKTKAPPKPRSTKRATATGPVRKAADKASSAARTATDKVGGKWGAAAIAGGLAAAGAAAAALLTLRGSSPKRGSPVKPTDTGMAAHQPDGTDSSKSFQAGIADENTVPGQA